MRKIKKLSTEAKELIALVIVIIVAVVVIYKVQHTDFDALDGTVPITSDDTEFEIQEYTFADENGYPDYLLVITNRSEYTVDLDCSVNAYEADDTLIGSSYNRINTIEPGNSGCLEFNFEYAYTDYYVSEPYYKESSAVSAMDQIEAGETVDSDGVTVTCSNTGDEKVQYLRADILFFKDGALVDYATSYLYEDGTTTLSAGGSISHTFQTKREFDDYEVYYSCSLESK